MAPSLLQKSKRQSSCDAYDPSGDCVDDWWWSTEGMAIRYTIVAVVCLLLILALFISYMHAQRRIRRGQAPLAYHRWLVSRRQPVPGSYPPQQQQHQYAYYQQHQQQMPGANGNGQGYPMQGYQMPPPAYGQDQWDAPPTYQPPTGASKVAADQNVGVRTVEVGEESGAGAGPSGVAAPERTHVAQ